MTYWKNIDVSTISWSVPTVGTFGQFITAFEVRDIAVKWEFQFYETNYDMLPVESTGDGTQSFEDWMLVGSSTKPKCQTLT